MNLNRLIIFCILKTFLIVAIIDVSASEKTLIEKKGKGYTLSLKEVVPDPNKVCTDYCRSCVIQQYFEDGFKLNEVSIEQLFILSLAIKTDQLDMKYTSGKYYTLEYHSTNRNMSDSLMISDLLDHFKFDLQLKKDTSTIFYINVQSQVLFDKCVGEYYGLGNMRLKEGVYHFTNYSFPAIARIINSNFYGDFRIKTNISDDERYTFQINKCKEISELEACLKKLGLCLQKEMNISIKYLITQL